MARVTFGMPLWNAEQFLARALASLLAQEYRDFELHICDNASTDGTQAICESFAARDARIRYTRNASNIGAAANFNLVFAGATTELFAWAAYDDTWDPTFLGKCVAALDANPDAVLAHTEVEYFGPEDRFVEAPPGRFLDGDDDAVERFRQLVFDRPAPLTIYGVVRSAALRRTRMLEPYLGGDQVLLVELALQGRFVQVHEPLWRYYTVGFAQGQSYVERIRAALNIENKLLPTLFPKLLQLSQYARVVMASDVAAADKAAMLRLLASWYAINHVAGAGGDMVRRSLGPARVDALRARLHQAPWYRRLRGLRDAP